MALVLFFEQTGMVGAEVQIGNGGEEAAVVAAPVDVATRSESYGIGSCSRFERCRLRGRGLRVGFGGQRDPSPGCFDARM